MGTHSMFYASFPKGAQLSWLFFLLICFPKPSENGIYFHREEFAPQVENSFLSELTHIDMAGGGGGGGQN